MILDAILTALSAFSEVRDLYSLFPMNAVAAAISETAVFYARESEPIENVDKYLIALVESNLISNLPETYGLNPDEIPSSWIEVFWDSGFGWNPRAEGDKKIRAIIKMFLDTLHPRVFKSRDGEQHSTDVLLQQLELLESRLPEGIATLLAEHGLIASPTSNGPIELNEVRRGAQSLLDSVAPSDLLSVFPKAGNSVHNAISKIRWENRRIVEHKTGHAIRSLKFCDVLTMSERRHFILAPGGSGKTYALWNLGQGLLASENTIPIYLPLFDYASVDDLEASLCCAFRAKSLDALLRYDSLVFLLDGWPQFAQDSGHRAESERRKLLALLGDARIIATGRTELASTPGFVKWDLRPLDIDIIYDVLYTVMPGHSMDQARRVQDLIAYPLMLILYLALAENGTTAGGLLREFQLYLTKGHDNRIQLLNVLADSVARVVLCRPSVTVAAFEEELEESSRQRDVQKALQAVHQIGTLEFKGDRIHAFHDLYWEWLLGMGMINDWPALNYRALQMPNIRKSLKLAIESDRILDVESMRALSTVDISLAAMFLPGVRPRNPEELKTLKDIGGKIHGLMASNRVVDKHRGVLAALASCDVQYYPSILDTISLLTRQGMYLGDLNSCFHSDTLWEGRELLFAHVDEPEARQLLVSAIQHLGGESWVEWAESKFYSGDITSREAIQIAVSCGSSLPQWVADELPTLISENEIYYLAAAARAGKNLALARWVADNYERQLASLNSSGWYHLNDILIYCGDHALHQELFDKFNSFNARTRDLLLYVYQNMGPEWVWKFQQSYPDLVGTLHSQSILNKVCVEVSDEIAREWTQSRDLQVQTHGWRTLAKKHQGAVIPELIEYLPASFNDMHSVPTLKAMSELIDAPESLLRELWIRLNGSIQPMLMDDFLRAIANIKPLGIPSIIAQLRQNPHMLSGYHLSRFIGYLDTWQRETGARVHIADPRAMEFGEYLVLLKLENPESSHVIFDLVRVMPTDAVLDKLVSLIAQQPSLVAQISGLYGISRYHEGLVSFLLRLPGDQGIKSILSTFQSHIVSFPEPILCNLLDIICASDLRSDWMSNLLYHASQRPTNSWDGFVSHLLVEVLKGPETSSQMYRHMALILREYPLTRLHELLEGHLHRNSERALWLIRMVEEITKSLLVNEEGLWIAGSR